MKKVSVVSCAALGETPASEDAGYRMRKENAMGVIKRVVVAMAKMKAIAMVVVVVMVALAGLVWAGSAAAQTTVIKAGNLVDPATGTVKKDQTIVVKDGKITAIGTQVSVPADATVIDLSKAWVLPGLMDAHTHLTLGMNPAAPDLEVGYLKESTGWRLLRGVRSARAMLEAGFTTVRDIGNAANYADTDLRVAIEKGWFPGPTILNAGKIIAPFGGQSHNIVPEQARFWQFEYIDADTPDEVRKAVRQNIYYGANTIKLVADNSAYSYSVEEIRAAVDETHRAGMIVGVHVIRSDAARAVIEGGTDSIEHGFDLNDEVLKLMKSKGVVLVGTDFPLEHLKVMGTGGGILPPPEQTAAMIVDRLKRAYKIGVKMAFGSDVVLDLPGKTRADMVMDYLDVWLAAGVPPAEILKAMTTNAAELFQWKGKRGAIAVGEAADIIAAPENPLANIKALQKVSFVMKDGRVMKQ